MSEENRRVIQSYLNDISSALRDGTEEDIMDIFRRLYSREQAFAKKLQSTAYGRRVYILFIEKIAKAQGGIKSAKSFFRARQNTFLDTVNKGINECDPKLIYPVPINYKFCLFAIESLKVKIKKEKADGKIETEIKDRDQKLAEVFIEIKKIREEIINKHLYLSMNRAKIHKKSTYGMSIDFEDLVQIANEALIMAVDKYVMDEDASSFHAMAIGRMLARLITNGTMVSSATIGDHAQKTLYKIRKILQHNPGLNTNEISRALDIAEEEVSELINATSYKSLDESIGEDGDSRYGDLIPDESAENQYEETEKKSLKDVLSKSFGVLSTIEKKVLILKGVKING